MNRFAPNFCCVGNNKLFSLCSLSVGAALYVFVQGVNVNHVLLHVISVRSSRDRELLEDFIPKPSSARKFSLGRPFLKLEYACKKNVDDREVASLRRQKR